MRSLGVGVIAHGTSQSRAPDAAGSVYDLERLGRAISSLVEENARLRQTQADLRGDLDEKSGRVLALEGQLLEANQRRQDVAKRLDELIAQMDALDVQLQQTERAGGDAP